MDQTKRLEKEVDERIVIEGQLVRAMEVAEGANHAKSQFLASMSHEIRTPLTAIVGYTEILNRPSQARQGSKELIKHIGANAKHLQVLINDILDISKIEAGQLSLHVENCLLVEVIEDSITLMKPMATEKLLDLSVTYESKVPRMFLTDPNRFRQILINLISNAIKFTDEGDITVSVRLDQSTEHGGLKLQVSVIDTGIGVSQDNIQSLFQLFSQVHDSSRKAGGTGLGLAISRRLARMMGGELSVESKLGHGSKFTFEVGVGLESDVELIDVPQFHDEENIKPFQKEVGTCSLENIHILVVDDNPHNLNIVSFLLEEHGAQVSTCSNGQEAVDIVTKASEQVCQFDIILMDMQMPVMDGYAAAHELRARSISVPVIALTAHAMTEDRDKCLSAGCNDYVAKPIDTKELYEAIGRHVQISQVKSKSTPKVQMPLSPSLSPMFANNPKFLVLVEQYVQSLPEVAEEIVMAQQNRNLSTLRTLVHRLKGTAGNYGYPQITEAARECEKSIDECNSMNQLTTSLDGLRELIENTAANYTTPESATIEEDGR